MTRTVYLPEKNGKQTVLKPVTVKSGISDGAFTEVTEGLKEGDVIVSGVNVPLSATVAGPGQRPPNTPFGGPFGGGGFRR